MNDRELMRAMDACRPGSDDLNLPEMQSFKAHLANDPECRQVFLQRQRLDRELSTQLSDVSLPPDLRQRILSTLEDREREPSEPVRSSASQTGRDRRTAIGDRLGRRKLIAIGVGLVATAACFVLILLALRPTPPQDLTPAQLASRAVDHWIPDPQAWESYDSSQNAGRYPSSRFVRTRPTRWQRMATELDRQSVVYEFESLGSARVRLYVLRVAQRLPQIPARPPENPRVGSRGWYTAVWQEVPHIYVLALEGSPESYYEYLRPGVPSLAVRRPVRDLGQFGSRPMRVLSFTQPVRPSRG